MEANITLDGIIPGHIDGGTVVINSSQQVVHLDVAVADLLGVRSTLPAPLEILPEPIPDFVIQALQGADLVSREKFSISSGNDAQRTVGVEASPFSFDDGARGMLLSLTSERPLNAVESRIHHVERLARLGILSAGLAHEIRNALVAVNAMTDLLSEQQQDNELAQTVRRELNRANDLASRMLKHARPTAHSRRPVSTHEILDRALLLAQSRFKEAGATINKSLQASPDLIAADESHMEQMFLNLLINAADSMDRSGEVQLTTDVVEEQAVGRLVRIAVKDTGVGIPPDVLPKLFQPFFTTKRHGTGLGLYLAQQIVSDHAGAINVSSTPGQGTCVQVYLPVHAA